MRSFVVLVSVLAFFSPLAFAWGPEGHKIVAQIASDLLSDTATQIISQFIGDRTLPDIAVIPDEYDHTAQGKWSAPCHYVNMPRDAANFTMSEDCTGCCVVKAILNYTSILQQTQSNPTQCSFKKGDEPCALIFLTHFVGDVHQPLHVGYGDDEGGNTVPVYFLKQDSYDNESLHHVWDTSIIEWWNKDFSAAADALEDLMSSEQTEVAYYASLTNPIEWADESYYWVKETVYNFTDSEIFQLKNPAFAKGLFKQRTSAQEVTLDLWYVKTNLPIIQQRLIAAGVRLATLLNSILTG